jgi:hypothetical protein
MNAMARLYERSNSNKLHASRPYMDPTVLRFFLVVHDNAEGTDLEEWVVRAFRLGQAGSSIGPRQGE